MENLKTAHPSPDRYREKWLNLNGEWDFSFDEPVFDKKINVPFSWTCPLSGIEAVDKKGTAYYRRVLKYTPQDRLFIIFDGVDYECSVFVNGELVKEHKGGYCRFDAEVTHVWKNDAENEIIVKATDRDSEEQMYGKQGYGNIRGIWQTVWLEERPESYIDKFRITTKMNGEVSVICEPFGEFVRLEVIVNDTLYASKETTLTFNVQNPRLWSPDEPELYDCTLRMYSKTGVDTVKTYFGIREIGTGKFDGKRYITLNGKPVYINAALDQSFNTDGHFTFPYDDYNREEILRAKELGLNALRIHIKTEEKLKLYWADKLGMLVIEDIPCFWGEPTEIAKENFEREMYEIIDRDINHPSVFYWVIFNETWGLKHFLSEDKGKWEYRKETQEWVKRLYRDVKAYDPTRLIEDNSPCNSDHVETDVNSWHLYINGYENMKKHCDEIEKTFVEGSQANYVQGYSMTDIPVMNSECGNYWGIKGNSGDSDISWHYKYMMNEFRLHDKICGFVFTELKDVINEFNGYYRLDDSTKYFGYENYNEGMTIKDLHNKDYLGFDCPPLLVKKPGEKVTVPLFVSSFDDKHHSERMSILWRLETETGIWGREDEEFGFTEISYNSYGTTFIEPLEITMPKENGIAILKLYLTDSQDEIVMSNFLLFDVPADISESHTVSLNELEGEGFKKFWTVQDGNKLNAVGKGEIRFKVSKKDLKDTEDGIMICFEASSKEALTKDIPDERNGDEELFDLMRGCRVDRGKNPNSFYMTDDNLYESNIEIYVEDLLIKKIILADDPADTTGCLSWHYQKVDDLLDEAGSYGYMCEAEIKDKLFETLPEEFTVTIKADNGISIFGRKSGRYPIEIEII